MPNARVKPGETAESARIRYNAEMRAWRAKAKAEGRLKERRTYDYTEWKHADVQRRYGITYPAAEALLTKQGGCCAICSTHLSLDNRGKQERSAIDHCHKTGAVRGILCMHCNQGLGKFRDDPDLLARARSYLLP